MIIVCPAAKAKQKVRKDNENISGVAAIRAGSGLVSEPE